MENKVGEFTPIDFNKTTVIKCYLGERKDI